MNQNQRTQYFSNLLHDHAAGRKKAYGSKELYYKGKTSSFPVFQIDLQYLVYNKYNGRIASYVKSLETQGRELDLANEDDIKIIEGFLWNSSEASNKKTEKDIFDKGQQEYGIVTKDGVIIDGNRRASILKRVANSKKETPTYFLAVVLDEELDTNPTEIMRLETTYQMGVDAKVDYNAIEKYLKCKDLRDYGVETKNIAKWMGEKDSKIEEYFSILGLMEEYLKKIGCPGMYTRLDKTEGAFVDLNSYLGRYEGNKSRLIQWKYGNKDLNELKLIYFDFIQAIYNKSKKEDDEGILDNGDSKDYRYIGQTSKKGSFFSNEDIWREFKEYHFGTLDPIREKFDEGGEYSVDKLREANPGLKQDELLKQRDKLWHKEAAPHLKKNLGSSIYRLRLKSDHEAPLELLKRAKSTLESVDTKSKAFLTDEYVYGIVKELNKIVYQFKKEIEHNEN